jgi:hypothetical protein
VESPGLKPIWKSYSAKQNTGQVILTSNSATDGSYLANPLNLGQGASNTQVTDEAQGAARRPMRHDDVLSLYP